MSVPSATSISTGASPAGGTLASWRDRRAKPRPPVRRSAARPKAANRPGPPLVEDADFNLSSWCWQGRAQRVLRRRSGSCPTLYRRGHGGARQPAAKSYDALGAAATAPSCPSRRVKSGDGERWRAEIPPPGTSRVRRRLPACLRPTQHGRTANLDCTGAITPRHERATPATVPETFYRRGADDHARKVGRRHGTLSVHGLTTCKEHSRQAVGDQFVSDDAATRLAHGLDGGDGPGMARRRRRFSLAEKSSAVPGDPEFRARVEARDALALVPMRAVPNPERPVLLLKRRAPERGTTEGGKNVDHKTPIARPAVGLFLDVQGAGS